MTELPGICELYGQFLRRFAQEELLSRTTTGRTRKTRPADIRSASSGSVAAYLVRFGLGPRREFAGSRELLNLALRCGDFFHADWVRRGHRTVPSRHFTDTFFLDIYEMLSDRLSSGRRRRWQETILAHSQTLSDVLWKKLSPRTTGRTALNVGCGPNHLYCWAAMLYRGGRLLGRSDFKRRAAWAVHRLLSAMDAQGFHPEHEGPALHYHALTLSGLGDYYLQSRDRRCREPLGRAVRFWCRTIYPDLSPIEVFDERNRWHWNFATGAHAAMLLFPEGRRYVRLAMQRLLAGADVRHRPGQTRSLDWHVSWMQRALRHCQDGPERTLPVERSRMLSRIGDRGLVRRSGAWVWALSAFTNQPWQTNPFFLDRIQNLSIWHSSAGLLVGGGNDKNSPDIATFYALEGKMVGYYRPRGAKIRSGSARTGDRVELDYGPIRAGVRVRALSDRHVRIEAHLEHWVLDLEPTFNLQLKLKPGSRVRLATGRTLTLSVRERSARTHPTNGRITGEGWELVGPKDMQLRGPHFPFDSYSQERSRHVESAVGIVTVPIPASGGRVTLDLTVVTRNS